MVDLPFRFSQLISFRQLPDQQTSTKVNSQSLLLFSFISQFFFSSSSSKSNKIRTVQILHGIRMTNYLVWSFGWEAVFLWLDICYPAKYSRFILFIFCFSNAVNYWAAVIRCMACGCGIHSVVCRPMYT